MRIQKVPRRKKAFTPTELRRQRFVEEYLKDMNGAQAAIRAGYAVRSAKERAYELLSRVEIQEMIAAAQTARSARVELSQDWVLERLRELVGRCMQHEAVTDHEGNPTGEYKFDAAGANRAIEMVAKHLGMFTQKHEIAGADGGPLVVQVVKFADDPASE